MTCIPCSKHTDGVPIRAATVQMCMAPQHEATSLAYSLEPFRGPHTVRNTAGCFSGGAAELQTTLLRIQSGKSEAPDQQMQHIAAGRRTVKFRLYH